MSDILKILMVQTSNMNLGDTILADNDYYLLKKALHPKKCDILRYSISSRDVGQLKYVDAVVFAGGILKCTNEKFHIYIPEIINEANRLNIPVFLSAIGVEKFYEDNEGSVALKQALNLPCVKGISVRDDIDTLKRDYLENTQTRTYCVYDPAVWCKDTYKKELKISKNKKELVGIGIARERLFADYGNKQIDRQFQLDLFKGIIDELNRRKIEWKVFTNGDPNDEIFAKEVLEYVGEYKKLDAPLSGVALVRNISEFSSVIAVRMHSNIISYALNIPSVGFIWNQKLRFWGKKIGYEERFIECENISVQNVISAWEDAVEKGCTLKPECKNGVYDALKDFADNFCFIREKERENLDFSKTMLAPALGGIDTRYKNTNSPQAFKYSLKYGYKNFQADIRLTSDNVAVCVNRWHKDTFKLLNHPMANSEKVTSIKLSEFENCKYYNRFDTMTFDTLLKLARNSLNFSKIKLVLSFGRPSKKVFEKLMSKITYALKRNLLSTKNIYLRLESKQDIEYVKASYPKFNIIYHTVDNHISKEETLSTLEDALKYCKEQSIKYLYMNHKEYTKEFDKLCKEYGVHYYCSACTMTQTVIESIKNGAYFVPSHYYDVDYITRLTR